ncbi:DUF3164 family protein [Chryseobacterium sp. G0162]|uniref:DUF3164 family protein n=1 Tax=Chryseobacterium sp. G0162 TaxID=2487063 RepID=UPI000F4F9465|nr:DUF3164 family protein [Chryseobacterium sp. G0162]AZB07468.1 DUF3164 family protein [Chryseobacterium sp. G0162]
MTTIDIKTLSPEQRKKIADDLKQIAISEKEKRANDLKALDDLAAETLPGSMQILREASENLEKAKAKVFSDFETYLKMKIETIGVKNNQQSHTITVGKESIKLGYRITDGYGENASYGIAMVHKFLESLGKDDNSKKILGAVMKLLQRNGKGDLDSKKVLELKQIADKDFPGTDFQKGVEIIQAEYKPKLSKWFIEAYYTDGTGIERSIPLSMTSVDLPKDTDLTFLLPKS